MLILLLEENLPCSTIAHLLDVDVATEWIVNRTTVESEVTSYHWSGCLCLSLLNSCGFFLFLLYVKVCSLGIERYKTPEADVVVSHVRVPASQYVLQRLYGSEAAAQCSIVDYGRTVTCYSELYAA